MSQPSFPAPTSSGNPIQLAAFLIAAVVAASIYANLSFLVTNSEDYRFFPPFERDVNMNLNEHLGAEYFNVARALFAGEGFANPFHEPTGPTAWMPPVFPSLLAGLLWVCNGDRDIVMVAMILIQLGVLAGTGFLMLRLVRQTTGRVGPRLAAWVFVVGFLLEFFLWFQFTHDVWLVLLILDLLLIGFCWTAPLQGVKSALCWGLFGGVCALTNPIVAFTWGVLTLVTAIRQRAWTELVAAGLIAGLTVTPWVVRNYLIFGCLIPVKSNAAYELYQSQCLTEDGLVEVATFQVHPYTAPGEERQQYRELGEIAYLKRKRDLFWQNVDANPADFCKRLARRLVAVTVWYVPFARAEEAKIPGWVWLRRLTYPLPFLAWCWLLIASFRQRLHPAQWVVMGIYAIYLLPYISISYYDRYAAPLVGVKMLLVLWGIERWRCRKAAVLEQQASSAAATADVGRELCAS